MRKNTRSVTTAWREGQPEERQRSIWTDGEDIYSYATCIAAGLTDERGTRLLVLNQSHYSPTTTNHQNGVYYALDDRVVGTVGGLGFGASPRAVLAAWRERWEGRVLDLALLAQERRPSATAPEAAFEEWRAWYDDALADLPFAEEREICELIRRTL